MEVRVYKAVEGSRLSDPQAAEIGQYLEAKFGDAGVTPEQFVAAARPKSSPLRKYVEWDDTTAARKYRLQQARWVMASIDVVTATSDGEVVMTRAFPCVVMDGERRYTPAAKVFRVPELYVQEEQRFINDLRALEKNYADFTSLHEEVETVRQIRRRIEAKQAESVSV